MKRPTKLEGHVDRLLKPHAHVTEARQRKRETVNLNAMQLAFLSASAEAKVERGQAKFVEDKPANGIPVVRAISCTDTEALRVKQLTIRVKALVRIRGRGLHPDVIAKAVKLATPGSFWTTIGNWGGERHTMLRRMRSARRLSTLAKRSEAMIASSVKHCFGPRTMAALRAYRRLLKKWEPWFVECDEFATMDAKFDAGEFGGGSAAIQQSCEKAYELAEIVGRRFNLPALAITQAMRVDDDDQFFFMTEVKE